MVSRSRLLRTFLLFLFDIYSISPAHAADSAFLQLSVASPDPVRSGSEITFQVILANNGTETWQAGRYYFEVQIYDSAKNYVIKTSRILGDRDVPPGEPALSYIPFTIPEIYAGPYFYRVFMTDKEQRIFEGNFTNFSVTPIPPQPPKEKPVNFGGDAILSLRTYSTTQNKDVLDFNLNSVGQVYGRSMVVNLNTQTTRPAHTKIIQALMTYYGPVATFNLGDVQPNFSPLSYSNSGARGLWVQLPIKNFSTEVIGAQTVFAVSGSSSPAQTGTFSRYVAGGSEKIGLPKGFTMGVNYVKVFDDRNSLSADPTDPLFRGPNPLESSNEVKSAGLNWKGLSQKLSLDGEFAVSDFQQNTLSDVPTTASSHGQAMRFATDYRGQKFTGRVSLQRTDPEFTALAAPGATADRLTYDLDLGYNQSIQRSSLGLTLSGNQFSDNVKSDPSKITTTQMTMMFGASLNNPTPWPALSLSASLNQGQDKDKIALDNKTQTMGVNINQPIFSQTRLALGIQQSQFTDNLQKSANLTTLTENLNLTTALGTRADISLGGSNAVTNSQATATSPSGSLTNISYSASLTWRVIKEKLVAQLWTTVATNKGTSSGTQQDLKNQSNNMEITYQLFKKLAVTAGWANNTSTNAIDSTQNTNETVLTGRLTLNF